MNALQLFLHMMTKGMKNYLEKPIQVMYSILFSGFFVWFFDLNPFNMFILFSAYSASFILMNSAKMMYKEIKENE